MILHLVITILLMIFKSCESSTGLSAFVEKNRLEEGREAAKVKSLVKKFDKLKSYAGFFEVNRAYESFMFFWYFPPIKRYSDKNNTTPVIVWLEGGVGTSSMVNALRGNGPLRLGRNNKLTYNKHNWANRAHLVYFDNPVGAGYSFSRKLGFPKTETEVATDLYSALKQFTTLFELNKNPIFLAGEGYAGKYISALGVMIDEQNRKGTFKMNLRGIAIENGFIDPPNMLAFEQYLYQLGVIDLPEREEFHKMRFQIERLLKGNKNREAQQIWRKWMVVEGKDSMFENYTGLPSIHDVTLVKKDGSEEKLLNNFLNQKSTRNALNAQNIQFSLRNGRVGKALEPDMLKSEARNLLSLANRYPVLLYNGQMNVIPCYNLMNEALKKYTWDGYKEYWHNKREKWYVGEILAGYWKRGGHLTELLMRNVGDRISIHHPKWAKQMIENFIDSKSLNDK